MASNVDLSCRIWDCEVDPLVIGELGSLEHLRDILETSEEYPSKFLTAGDLVWLSDLTPHEALPLAMDSYRQYFRLVTHKVSVWYEKHSTKNPLGIVPDPEITRVLDYDKFVDSRARAVRAENVEG